MKEKDLIAKAVSVNMPNIESVRDKCLNQEIKADKEKAFDFLIPADHEGKEKRQKGVFVKRFMPVAFVLFCVVLFGVLKEGSSDFTGHPGETSMTRQGSGPALSTTDDLNQTGNVQPKTPPATASSSPVTGSSGNSSVTNPRDTVPKTTQEVWTEIPRWKDMTVEKKYGEIRLSGTVYVSMASKISPYEIDRLLKKATAKGVDIYSNDREYTIGCSVYSVKSISSDCVVAVKFDGYEGYYSYTNLNYTPATLGDLINDLNLHENLVFNKIYYSYWKNGIVANGNYVQMEYTLPGTSVIWDLLLFDPSLKNAGDRFYGASSMDISIDVKIAGHKNISLAVNDDGYLQTNILNTGKTFFIGKDKVQAFINYVLVSGSGKEIKAADNTTVPVMENGSAE